MTWQQIVGLITFFIGLEGTIVAAYFGLKADNAELKHDVSMSLLRERSDRLAEHVTLKDTVMECVSRVESLVKDLVRRVTTLEGGQDEWTKSLRARTHELANQVNELMLKVDRLERPNHKP